MRLPGCALHAATVGMLIKAIKRDHGPSHRPPAPLPPSQSCQPIRRLLIACQRATRHSDVPKGLVRTVMVSGSAFPAVFASWRCKSRLGCHAGAAWPLRHTRSSLSLPVGFDGGYGEDSGCFAKSGRTIIATVRFACSGAARRVPVYKENQRRSAGGQRGQGFSLPRSTSPQ